MYLGAVGSELKCKDCEEGSIAINSGFVYDAKMDLETYFPDRLDKNLVGFSTSCYSIDVSPKSFYKEAEERLSYDCQAWIPSGRSLIAQRPANHLDVEESSFVMFDLTYESMFYFPNSTVSFKYRAAQIQRGPDGVTGQLEFSIDGESKPLNVTV